MERFPSCASCLGFGGMFWARSWCSGGVGGGAGGCWVAYVRAGWGLCTWTRRIARECFVKCLSMRAEGFMFLQFTRWALNSGMEGGNKVRNSTWQCLVRKRAKTDGGVSIGHNIFPFHIQERDRIWLPSRVGTEDLRTCGFIRHNSQRSFGASSIFSRAETL